MALIVQKFGGTSVGNTERIRNVARRVLDSKARGNEVVVVVSAMAGETNRLVELALSLHPIPHSREYDLLLASGEQVAVGLLSLAINAEAEKRGLISRFGQEYLARPFLGHQLGILTDQAYSRARIQAIDTTLLHQELSLGAIPVIAGFQGVDTQNNITTLGRGGSDTSAVAIAAALGADDCEIYTDVDGVYTTDPRLCSRARKIDRICHEEMMELAGVGAKVLQIRSVELAAKFKVPVHVRSSFDHLEGTRVVSKESLGEMEQVIVAGVAADPNQSKFTLQGIQENLRVTAQIFESLAHAGIVVDVIVQDIAQNARVSLSFTVGHGDAAKTRHVLDGLRKAIPALTELRIIEEEGLAKVSVVGVGMQHHPGVAARMFGILADAGVSLNLVSTSEIKISALIPASKVKAAVEALHHGFGLEAVERDSLTA